MKTSTRLKRLFGLFMFILLLPTFHSMLVDSKNSKRWDPTSKWQKLGSAPSVQMRRLDPEHVVLDNGLLKLTLSTPAGMITGIEYNGIDNLLEITEAENQRGYWDTVWDEPDKLYGIYSVYHGNRFKVISENESQIEVSFQRTWDPSLSRDLPLNIDKRYVMLRGSSGFYSYAIYEHVKGWPDIDLAQTRLAFKLQKNSFHYMAISDTRQRVMPTADERARGQALDYAEAVRLPNDLPNPDLRGEVDDKYQYSGTIKDIHVHGWISPEPRVGFWLITPSDEFRAGGPLKQELTSHVGPTSLFSFFSTHYCGEDLHLELRGGEAWKKVYGPVFIYLNTGSSKDDYRSLWNDAKEQMLIERNNWPYNFPLSVDYPYADQRGTVTGRLLVGDKYIHTKGLLVAGGAYVGLAPEGEQGSWQKNTKGYQFWIQTDAKGNFIINNVRQGSYNLYAWIPGIIGDFKHGDVINILPGSRITMDDVVYEPPRVGLTLWEIGIPDRTAHEFYVPDPYPDLLNHLYVNNSCEKFRQYGLWNRYTDLYPKDDLVYKVGVSDYQKDWFFAHVNRNIGNGTYEATTWQIVFDLPSVDLSGTYTLWVALATSTGAKLKVGINNDPSRTLPNFISELTGRDNSIARHGIHGLYRLWKFDVPSKLLQKGSNAIFLQQGSTLSQFCGLMYDYIRFEGSPGSSPK